MYTVKDGQRELRFDGELLAISSSKTPGRTRWVEFELYRTAGGQYVLSRVGRSLYFHDSSCRVVKRNRIPVIEYADMEEGLLPCEECYPHPEYDNDEVCPEQPRYWAQVSSEPEGVVESLQKFDDHGTRYLTNVARHLLCDAAQRDEGIMEAFSVEVID